MSINQFLYLCIKIIQVLFGMFVIGLLLIWIWFRADIAEMYRTILPNSRTFFNYETTPLILKIKNVQYKIPKAYLSNELIYKEGKLEELDIWASIKDNMEPWTLSQSFKNRDDTSVVFIRIYGGVVEPYRSEFPYMEINMSKKLGGGINRGLYKNIFTRYDDFLIKNESQTGLVVKETLHSFYLIPHFTKEKYFIECPAIGLQTVNCTVRRLYKKTVTYEFLIPHRIVEHFLEYDQQVEKLISSLIYEENGR